MESAASAVPSYRAGGAVWNNSFLSRETTCVLVWYLYLYHD